MCKSIRQKMCKAFKQASTYIVVENFGTGDEALSLRSDGSSNLWSSMSDVRYTIARGAIDIFTSLFIPY
jgi:hypothetical protein